MLPSDLTFMIKVYGKQDEQTEKGAKELLTKVTVQR